MNVLAELEEEYTSASLTRSSTRRSDSRSGQRNSERRTGQRDSCFERASYKKMPSMSDRRTDRTTARTTTRVSEYGEVSDHELVGASEAPVLVAGIASMLKLRKRVQQQKSEGYRSVMETECIVPRRKVQSNPVHPQPSGSSNAFGAAYPGTEPVPISTSTSEDFLDCTLQDSRSV
jgi:hypothetical protein